MNGLEEIVLTIKQKADTQCSQITDEAKKKAESIKADAEATGKAEYDALIAAATRKCEQMKEAAASAAVSNRFKEILKFKSQTVSEVIEKMLDELRSLGDKEYFEIIEKLIYSNYHKNESGKLLFGEADLKRIPEGFAEKINETLKKDGAQLVLGEKAGIKDGFILSYGDIEENCGFDAIVRAKEDALKDAIASILFT